MKCPLESGQREWDYLSLWEHIMSDSKSFPKTVNEAVDRLIEELDDDVLAKVRDSTNLTEFHFGLGMYIRNQFGIWGRNEELLKDAQARFEIPDDKSDVRYYLFMHPDNASDVILEELQKRLREIEGS